MGKVERLKVFNPDKPEIHPAAAVFPMMDEEALNELARDIKENGQIVPIIVDEEGVLLDGRNRLAACKIAGVEPLVQRFEAGDKLEFIIGSNINRRHLTKSQQAMAYAMVYPEPEKGGRGKKINSSVSEGFSAARLSQARTVLKYSEELARQVVAGDMSLDKALEQVTASQGQLANDRSRLRKLREERPDLATAVTEERMTLDEAFAKAKSDAAERKQLRWTATVNLIDALVPLDRDPEDALSTAEMFDFAVAESRGQSVTSARLRRAAEYLSALADQWDED